MLDDDPRGFRKKRGTFSRVLRHHGIVAWTVVVALTILFWRTRTSLLSQVAQLKEFSTASESEKFEKITKMNENIASKNKEIAELNKVQRSLQKSMRQCEDEKASFTRERESSAMKIEKLAYELSDSRKEAEKYRRECHEVVQAKDTAHVEKDARIQQLQDEINRISEQLKTSQEEKNTAKGTSEQKKVEEEVKHEEEHTPSGTTSSGGGGEQQQQHATNEGQDTPVQNEDKIRITEESNNPDEPSKADESLKRGKKGRKKNLGMLKEHMGVGRDDY